MPPSRAPTPDANAALAALRILIVEDTGLIASELQWRLERLGCRIVGPAARLEEAAALARSEELDGVLLDVNLAGRDSYPVAVILAERDIPFILISGYDRAHLIPEYASAPHLQKPFGREQMTSMMLATFVRG